MKYSLALLSCAALLFSIATPASATEKSGADALTISRLGDVDMACSQLSSEALAMRDVIAATQDQRDVSRRANTGIGVAGAVGGFLVGTVTGGIGLAAAGLLAKEASNEKAENAEEVQDIAYQRRALMIGIYNAKGCFGPMEHALQEDNNSVLQLQLAGTESAAGQEETQVTPSYNQ